MEYSAGMVSRVFEFVYEVYGGKIILGSGTGRKKAIKVNLLAKI